MSKVDWSKAPEGAGFYVNGTFGNSRDGVNARLFDSKYGNWFKSPYKLLDLQHFDDYEERPYEQPIEKPDNVRKPSHYQLIDGVESIEIIARSMTAEQWKGFCLGNMLKYRIRAGKKDALQQDIDKANYYGELYELHKDKCYESNN